MTCTLESFVMRIVFVYGIFELVCLLLTIKPLKVLSNICTEKYYELVKIHISKSFLYSNKITTTTKHKKASGNNIIKYFSILSRFSN